MIWNFFSRFYIHPSYLLVTGQKMPFSIALLPVLSFMSLQSKGNMGVTYFLEQISTIIACSLNTDINLWTSIQSARPWTVRIYRFMAGVLMSVIQCMCLEKCREKSASLWTCASTALWLQMCKDVLWKYSLKFWLLMKLVCTKDIKKWE